MEDTTTKWFRDGLGPRVDALKAALKALADNDPEAVFTIKHMAQSLRSPSGSYGLFEIYDAAERVEQSTSDELEANVRLLIDALRTEAAKVDHAQQTMLIVGGSRDFNEQLVPKLLTPWREVLQAETAAEAKRLIREREIVFVVLNMFLPDLDGRSLPVKLRENPSTAAIRVLVLAPKVPEPTKHDNLMIHADGYIEAPLDAKEVAAWVNARLRRAHETTKEARRDNLTGLLNRAAFREDAARLMESCLGSQEPLALAVFSIDGSGELMKTHGQATADMVLRHVGSLLATSLRTTDIVARWGMPEFVSLLPGEDQFGGVRAAEKVMKSLSKQHFAAPEGTTFQLTLSAGVAVVAQVTSIDNAVAEADRYLFHAKSLGGNRVTSSQTRSSKRRNRVLILGEDEVTAKVLNHLFEKDGSSLVYAERAETVFSENMRKQRFHLVLIGDKIPDSTPFEVLQRLRKSKRYNRIPIVMLTSKHSEADLVHALELGANDYVIRPFSPSGFMTRMRRILTRAVETVDLPSGVRRIMIIDAEVRNLLIAASSLHERGGFQVYLAKGSRDAYDRMDETQPDVVVVDADKPESGGMQLLKTLSRTKDSDELNIIVSSTSKDLPDMEESLASQVKGILNKPFSPLTLAQQIERILRMPRSKKQSPDAADHFNNEVQRVVCMDKA